MESLDDIISAYSQSVDELCDADDASLRSRLLSTLATRDEISVAPTSAAVIEEVAGIDRKLIAAAPRIESLVGRQTLIQWQRARTADDKAWWWRLHELPAPRPDWKSRVLTIVAALFLTASIGLVADTFNLLRTVSENPIGTIGTLIQAALAFVAVSAFTPAGRKWLIDVFSHLGFGQRRHRAAARTVLAFVILGLTFFIRVYLPQPVAGYFQSHGDQLLKEGLVQSAIPAYQEAVTLQPYSVETNLALAKAQEQSRDYRKAIEYFRSTIGLYERQRGNSLDDAYYEAKIRLARLLILQEKDYAGVLALLVHPEAVLVKLSPQNQQRFMYFWFTYLGWANLELKYYQSASDNLCSALGMRDGAAARYLMGRVFDERQMREQACAHWRIFIKLLQDDQLREPNQRYQEQEVQVEWRTHAQDKLLQASCDKQPPEPRCWVEPQPKPSPSPSASAEPSK